MKDGGHVNRDSGARSQTLLPIWLIRVGGAVIRALLSSRNIALPVVAPEVFSRLIGRGPIWSKWFRALSRSFGKICARPDYRYRISNSAYSSVRATSVV
jgi:hypothetical protein